MFELIFLFTAGVCMMAICIDNVAGGKYGLAWVSGIISIVAFSVATFVGGPILGYGTIPEKAEELKVRLKTGVRYQVVSSLEDRGNRVLIIQQTGTTNLYALRVVGDIQPPEHFVLVDGKSIAIVAPTPPNAEKKK